MSETLGFDRELTWTSGLARSLRSVHLRHDGEIVIVQMKSGPQESGPAFRETSRQLNEDQVRQAVEGVL